MPDPYEVKLTKRAHKELAALDRVTQQRIDNRLLKLADEPFPPDVEKLSGIDEDWYRVRVGDYRIIYDVDEGRDCSCYPYRSSPRGLQENPLNPKRV